MTMELFQAENVDASLKASVSEIIASNKICLDTPWQDYEVLNAAVREGKQEVANQLLNIGFRVNNPMEQSDTPLHNAVKLGDVYLVKKLLEKDASITASNSDSNTPVHLAFLIKYYEIVDLMLLHIQETSSYDDMINKDGLTHLHIACAQGNAQLVYSYDYVGANINSVVKNSSAEYSGYTCLQFACDSKCQDTIKVVSRAIKLLGNCLDKEKKFFRYTRYSSDWGRSIINTHHLQGYSSDKAKTIVLSDLQSACFNGNLDKVKEFLEKGEDVNAPVPQDAIACPLATPLHLAVEAYSNRQKVVELLLAEGADVNLKNGFHMTPLHCALYSDPYREEKPSYSSKHPDQDDSLKVIYEAAKDKESNPMDPFGLTYFHAAVALNDMEMVKKFIKTDEDDCKPILPNSRNFSMYTPLHFAVKYGHEDMAKLLIERGADVNANEDQNQFDTPLQVAIKYGQCKMVDFLLAHGANPKVVAYDGDKSALDLLVYRFGDYEDEKPGLLRLVDTLISYGVDVNSLSSAKFTPLHTACWRIDKASEIILELLNQGADINALNKHDEVPFNLAERKNSGATPDVLIGLYYHVKKLKQLGVKVDPKNDEFCEKVMKKKEEWKESDEWPAIEKICSNEELMRRQKEWIQEIEKLKVDMLSEKVSLYDYLRMEAKEAVEFIENERIVKLIADEQLRSVYATYYGYLIPVAHRNSLRWLESQQPKQEEVIQGDPITSRAINGKLCSVDLVPPIYRPKKPVNSNEDNDEQQLIPANISLHEAIKLGNIKWVKELLAKGASTKFVDDKKNGPLHLAFVFNHGKIVDLLLSRIRENSEYVNWTNDQGITQLHIAASRGDTFVVEKLVDAGANAADFVHENSPMYPGYTALQFACDVKSLETAKVLTKAMKVCGNVTDEIEKKFARMSHLLTDQSFGIFLRDVTLLEKESLSKFHEACLSDETTARQVLQFLTGRVDVNAPMNRDSKKYPLYTALHFAVESSKDRQGKVELLLEYGADVDRKNGFGMSPLHLACYSDTNKDKMANPFERREKKVDNTLQILYDAVKDKEANPMDAFGLTYFHIAVAQNDLRLVKTMLFRGEDVNARVLPNMRDFSDYTPLHFAARFGRGEMAKILIERGARVYDADDNPRYYTPLQTAIINGKCDVIGVLLEYGANTKVVHPSTKKTTLHLVADRFVETSMETSEGQDEKSELSWFVEKLVKGGASVDAEDSDGFTALHSCCANLSECSHMVRWLLYMGADVNVKARGKTALEYANESWFRDNVDDYFVLYEHVQKLKDLGLKVDPKNEKFCEELITRDRKKWEERYKNSWFFNREDYTDEALAKKKRERQEEICKLKRDMLMNKVSMYNYIRMNAKQASAFLGNERLRKIDGIVEAEGLYGSFGYLIPVVYRKSQQWLEGQGDPENTAASKPAIVETQSVKRKRS